MRRNTYIVILIVAVLAALMVGLNAGRRMGSYPQTQPLPEASPPASTAPSETPSPALSLPPAETPATGSSSPTKGTLYKNAVCGISLTYPQTLTVKESTTSTNGAIFSDPANVSNITVLTCQKDIPVPPLPPDQIESRKVGTISATLYHDSSAKDGTKVDALIFTHPSTGMDVFIGGFGNNFNAMISTLKIL